ncbi:MAG TPA: TIGR02449 family protein [Candidatus Tenderia electrophaga]|uniref:TIGR02449 family protein n=1 Tax=Candidatus Tenderia electrophaga TaxID=1748243 RepID=A0A832J9E7_9GAMM|nr:TIGR02449 family protein [Candidatus Tenderia electrophaga]
MSQEQKRNQEQDLKTLEYRVDELIQLCHHLKGENQALRDQQGNLMSERASLMEKNEMARSRIEAMIMRLKTMESEYGQ